MALILNTAEGGNAGDTVTPANSGGLSGTAWNVVTIGAASSLTYSMAQRRGMMAYAIAPAANEFAYLRWNTTANQKIAYRHYIYATAQPTAGTQMNLVLTSASGQLVRLNWNTTGLIAVFNNVSGLVVGTTTNTLPLNQWVRLEMLVDIGAVLGTGVITFSMYSGDSGTAIETISVTAQNLGVTQPAQVRFARQSVGATATFYLDDLAVEDGAAALIGAAPPAYSPNAGDGRGLVYHLNRKAGTLINDRPTLEAAGAASAWAAGTGLELVDALNVKAGNPRANYRELVGALNQLAGTTGLEVDGAAASIP